MYLHVFGMKQPVHYIFTMGVRPGMRIDDLVALLREKGVDCVVDVRGNRRIGDELDGDVLAAALKREGLVYLSFHEEFGWTELAWHALGSGVDDARVRADEHFVHGIGRLQKGMQKGYVILLLGVASALQEDFRFGMIGRRLTELGYQVWHIMEDGRVCLQTALEAVELQRRKELKERAGQAAELGRTGEDIAADYLRSRGYTVLDRNWNLHRGCEIDIVARLGDVVHFVEVKTRSWSEGAMAGVVPESAINWRKMRHIFRAAKLYKNMHGLWAVQSQVDSIAIVVRSPDDYDLQFFEDVRYVERRFY